MAVTQQKAALPTQAGAAAPLTPDVAAFFAGLGMTILEVYGMTETTGLVTANTARASGWVPWGGRCRERR